ncbi:hypothetical protein OG912_00070 [Streptomyces sp. NBC_00464]|uniref:hypothetical protein n=1 Tax=Streptomyces sp. NBC_00464 TaxID=2975751 RepID=UPI002E186EC6
MATARTCGKKRPDCSATVPPAEWPNSATRSRSSAPRRAVGVQRGELPQDRLDRLAGGAVAVRAGPGQGEVDAGRDADLAGEQGADPVVGDRGEALPGQFDGEPAVAVLPDVDAAEHEHHWYAPPAGSAWKTPLSRSASDPVTSAG